MDSELYGIITTLLTLFLGGGWFVNWRAGRRKAQGEATQAEADGWARQQEVYQKTIEDLEGICDRIREDRNHLRDDRNMLREENEEMRKKYKVMEGQISEMQEEINRLKQMLESISPSLCGNPACMKRIKIDLDESK